MATYLTDEEIFGKPKPTATASPTAASEPKYLSDEEIFGSPMKQLEEKTKAGFKDLGKLPFWLAGQAAAFPMSGAAGLLGTITSGGDTEYGQRAAAVIPDLVNEYTGSPITQAIDTGLHKANEFLGNITGGKPPMVDPAQWQKFVKQPEYQNYPQELLQQEAMRRGVGEQAIPSAMGATLGRGIARVRPQPNLEEGLAKLKELKEKQEVQKQGPDIPENVIPYSTENLPFEPRPTSDAPFRQVEREIPTTLEERDAILGKRNLVNSEEQINPLGVGDFLTPQEPQGRIDFKKPEIAPDKPIKEQQPPTYITRGGTEGPWELSGKAGSEGPPPMDVAWEALKKQHPEMFTFDPTKALDFLTKGQARLTKKITDQDRVYQSRRGTLENVISQLDQGERLYRKTGELPPGIETIEEMKQWKESMIQELQGITDIYHQSQEILLAQRSMLKWKEVEQNPDKYHPSIKELMKEDMEWARGVLNRGGKTAEIGKLPWGGEDINKFYTFNPMDAIKNLLEASGKGRREFEKRLIDIYGEDIRPYAKTLYAAAKAEQRKESQKFTSALAEQDKAASIEALPRSQEGQDAVRWGAWDRRSGDQIKQDLIADDSINDIPNRWFNKMGRMFTQGQKYGRQHPILNWVYGRLDWTERDINRTANEIMYGENFVEKNWRPFGKMSSLRRAAREADPDSMMYKYNQLNDQGKENVRRVGDKYNGVKDLSVDELRSIEGLSMPEVEAYLNIRKGLDKMWDDVIVKMAEKVGITDKLPGKIPGYLPMSWFGEYRVWGKNPETGERIVVGANSQWEANRVIEKMKTKLPDFEFRPQDVTNIHKEFTSTPDAFLDAIRLFGRNSEAGKILYDAMAEIQMRRGASKHRLARNPERTQGYAGSLDQGREYMGLGRPKILSAFERSLEGYVQTGVRYAKNKELMYDMDKALKDPDFRKKFPNAVDLGENLRDSYLGADKFLDATIDKAMIDLGQSTNLPRATLSTIASMVMYTKVMAARVPFYLAQAVQDVFVVPRMMELQANGLKGNLNTAILKGHIDWLDGSKRVEDIRWAVKYGVVDPKFQEQITFIPHVRGRKVDLTDIKNTASGNRASAALDQSVRLKSYLMLLNFAESAGLKGNAAREVAARNSLDIMVEYEGWKRSPAFRETGTMGSAFSPLTTFTNNLINRLVDYTKLAGTKSAKPLAAVAMTYMFLSGLYGFPFRQDIDNAIDLLNEKFDMDMWTPTDWMIKNSDWLGDVGLFGVPSGLTGWQLGGSLGSPEVIGALAPTMADPSLKFLSENVGNAGSMMSKAISGQPITDAEMMGAWKGIAPTAPGHGLIENYFSPQNSKRELSGMLPQTDYRLIPDKNMEGGYRRSPAEQTARLFGVKSIDETKDTMKRHRMQVKSEKMEVQRQRAITSAVDGIMAEKGVSQDSIQRFIKNGGEPNDLMKAVETKVMDRLMDFRERETKNLTTQETDANLYRKIKLLEEFKLLMKPERRGEAESNIRPAQLQSNEEELMNKTKQDRHQFKNSLSRDMLFKEAEKLFPGNKSRQADFIRDVLKRMDHTEQSLDTWAYRLKQNREKPKNI